MELLRIEITNFGVKNKNINKSFSKLMTRHSYLLNHAKLLVDAISFVLVMQLLISSILICVMGKYFLTNINNVIKYCKSITSFYEERQKIKIFFNTSILVLST